MKAIFGALFVFLMMPVGAVQAHCQIPCGIFGDERTFDELEEDIVTIEKSMNEINTLSAQTPLDIHTIARWTTNKEKHAQKIQQTALDYFLAQRVKEPKADADDAAFNDYVTHTTMLHRIIAAATKAKQTTDTAQTETLKDLVAQYRAHYFKEHGHDHKDERKTQQ